VADYVESVLARSIAEATAAARWDIVSQLASELQARRTARAGVVELAGERAKRERYR
jgi:hypothetical protein